MPNKRREIRALTAFDDTMSSGSEDSGDDVGYLNCSSGAVTAKY